MFVKKAIMHLKCKLAMNRERRVVYEWENDKATRAISINTSLFSYISHIKWWRKLMGSNKDFLFIVNVGVHRVSFIRFMQSGKNIYEVSVIVNAQYRGRGLGTKSLSLAIKHLRQLIPRGFKLKAKIKEGNLSSLGAFHRANFKTSNKVDGFYFCEYRPLYYKWRNCRDTWRSGS